MVNWCKEYVHNGEISVIYSSCQAVYQVMYQVAYQVVYQVPTHPPQAAEHALEPEKQRLSVRVLALVLARLDTVRGENYGARGFGGV